MVKVYKVIVMSEAHPYFIKAIDKETAKEYIEYETMRQVLSCRLATDKEIQEAAHINDISDE